MSDRPLETAHDGDDLSERRGAAWLRRAFLAERDRWILWLPVGLGVGVATYFSLENEPPAAAGPGLLAILVLVAWWRRGSSIVARLVIFSVVSIALGFALAQARTVWVAAPVVDREHGPAWVSGQLLEVEPRPVGHRIVVAVEEIEDLPPDVTPHRVRLSLRTKGIDPVPGIAVRVRAVLLPPPEPAAPGAFDFARTLYFKRIGAVGYAVGGLEPRDGEGVASGSALGEHIAAVRLAVATRITDALRPEDAQRGEGQSAEVAVALLTGLRGRLSEDTLSALRDAGLAHLLAISGLHLGLIAGILFFSVRLLLALNEPVALRFPIKKWAAVAALVGAFGYLLLTGATIPTQRAYIMVSLVLVAVLIDREAVSMRPVAWAAVLVLVLRPESFLGASFQLSFAAVTALVAFYEWLRTRSKTRTEPRRGVRWLMLYFAAVMATTVVASLATAPFAAYHFNRVAVAGLFANLIAVPTTALWIMPWGLLALVLMPLGLETLALTPMAWGIELVIAVAQWCADLPGAVVAVAAWPPSTIVLITVGGLWLTLWRAKWRLLGIAPMIIGLAIAAIEPRPVVLIDESGRLFAVRGPEGGLALSTRRRAKFDAGIWLRRDGTKEAAPWVDEGPDAWPDDSLVCDSLGCRFVASDGTVVALVSDPSALAEDCASSDVVVSAVPIRVPCDGARMVIDRFDLWRDGAHAIWLTDDTGTVAVRSVRQERGSRPWVSRR
jgi:competence protein ComEC